MVIIAPTDRVDVPAGGHEAALLVQQVLSVMRGHTGMEVAFLSRVAEGRRRFEFVDADPRFCPVEPGQSDELGVTYCGRVLDGRIPELIIDAALEPGVADLDVTRALPIGSHISVPVLTSTGEVFGTLCCFSRHVQPDLHERDVQSLRLFAAIVSRHLDALYEHERAASVVRNHIGDVLDDGGPRMALQPIVDLASGRVDGYEALARFPDALGRTPDRWFSEADRVGLGTALESSAVRAAMRLLPRLPAHVSLAVNVSAPALLADPGIVEMFLRPESPCLVLELTEHHKISDHDALSEILARVRDRGVRVAVDDAGSGYAGLERILWLSPEVLKLDRTLVEGIADHLGRQAMCEAMVGFTRRMGAILVAEGVETQADLGRLRALGVHHAQGYLLGRPEVWPGRGPVGRASPASTLLDGSPPARRDGLACECHDGQVEPNQSFPYDPSHHEPGTVAASGRCSHHGPDAEGGSCTGEAVVSFQDREGSWQSGCSLALEQLVESDEILPLGQGA